MNIKLDENLPERLVAELSALGHDVDTVRAERLAGRDDTDVWQVTHAAERFLVTQDLGDHYALDPYDDEVSFWLFRLRLRPPRFAPLHAVWPSRLPMPWIAANAARVVLRIRTRPSLAAQCVTAGPLTPSSFPN